MLGEKIGEISGKVTMQRVLPNLGGDPKMETSFQATGSVLGTNIKDTGTYTTIFRPDGTQYGEGQGIMITKDGKTANKVALLFEYAVDAEGNTHSEYWEWK